MKATLPNSRIVCECGGLRKVQRNFKSEKQAQLALRILQSGLIVRDGREFSMTVQEYERVCNKEVKRGHLKLYRAPLAFDPSTVSADQQALPVDPTLNLRLTPKVRLNLVMSSILKMDLTKANRSHDTRPFTVSDEQAGEYRVIEVRGGKFQGVRQLGSA